MICKDAFVQSLGHPFGKQGAAIVYGIVEQAGPKTFIVWWKSGARNRVWYDRPGDVKLIKDRDLLDDAKAEFARRPW